jgi:hypothetical protein
VEEALYLFPPLVNDQHNTLGHSTLDFSLEVLGLAYRFSLPGARNSVEHILCSPQTL